MTFKPPILKNENTVLGYKKRSKYDVEFSKFETLWCQLSNALSNVFILCLEPKIQGVEKIWVPVPSELPLNKKNSPILEGFYYSNPKI